MSLFGKSKREKAIDALKVQFGIDLYEDGQYNCDKWLEYKVSILEGYDFMAVINRKAAGKLVAKEWYIYDKHVGWVKKASMDRKQSYQLYADTKPYYIAEMLEEFKGKIPAEKIETASCMMLDEYISTYMTEYYFGFSIKEYEDLLWRKGSSHTQAIYMPHRDPDPRNESHAEHTKRMKRLDETIDQVVDLLK